jgi:hypothetical protein
MSSYLMRAWRGQQHVAWALLVNGLLGCLMVILAWGIVSDSTPLSLSQQILCANLTIFWAWFLWAIVGILRSALRALREQNKWLSKAIAVLAFIVVLGSGYEFVSDLPDTINGTPRLGGPIVIGKPHSAPRREPQSTRTDFRKPPASVYNIGDRVVHKKFGSGTVTDVDGDKLTIAFDSGGKKRLIDSFVDRE